MSRCCPWCWPRRTADLDPADKKLYALRDVTATVDRVRLSYSRISEKDSFDTGLVVPVWSFEGKVTAYSGEYPAYERNGTLLAVNAIDGSVIDADLGY